MRTVKPIQTPGPKKNLKVKDQMLQKQI